MSFTIPSDSPKAVQAAEFGAELVKACRTRDIPFKELERACGVGHTGMDNYRRGLILPRTATAYVLSDTLRWPKLRTLIERFRTATCARPGCGMTFRNEGGGPKIYCTLTCRTAASSIRVAETRARQGGRTKDGRRWSQQTRLLKSGLRVVSDELFRTKDAIGAMCRECELEGICRTSDCPLRAFSPLPYAEAEGTGFARTLHEVRVGSWTPARRARFVADLHERWARPGAREEASVAQSPHLVAARVKSLAANRRRSPESFSAASKKAWATRRAKA